MTFVMSFRDLQCDFQDLLTLKRTWVGLVRVAKCIVSLCNCSGTYIIRRVKSRGAGFSG
jgi:hypothetical protein